MSALADVAPSLLTAARGVIAAFGCLCIVIHAVLPCLTTVGGFVTNELPTEISKWQLMRTQRTELQDLEDRVAILKERHTRRQRDHAQRAHEDYQTQANRRQEALRRKRVEATARTAVMEDTSSKQQRAAPRVVARQQISTAPDVANPSIPKRRTARPLGLLSPNVPIDRRPVPAYVKASVSVTKPIDEPHRSQRFAASKARNLSLGNIFDEVDDENTVPPASMWAH